MSPRSGRRLRRAAGIVFLACVAVLLVVNAGKVEWREVAGTLREYRGQTLLLALILAALSHTAYSTFDLLGRAYTRHSIPRRRVLGMTFVSYVFNLNLGAILGGIGFRYHLYGRQGLDAPRITRILALSLMTNWLGYVALGGAVMAFAFPGVAGVPAGSEAARAAGAAILLACFGYLVLCGLSRRRIWRIGRAHIELPPLKLAMTQIVLATLNWLLMGAILFVLFEREVPFARVLTVLMLASVAAIVVHIPAGLGVLEAVFLSFLGYGVPGSQIIAALLAYRAVYYLLPLLVGIVLYFAVARRGGGPGADQPGGRGRVTAAPSE